MLETVAARLASARSKTSGASPRPEDDPSTGRDASRSPRSPRAVERGERPGVERLGVRSMSARDPRPLARRASRFSASVIVRILEREDLVDLGRVEEIARRSRPRSSGGHRARTAPRARCRASPRRRRGPGRARWSGAPRPRRRSPPADRWTRRTRLRRPRGSDARRRGRHRRLRARRRSSRSRGARSPVRARARSARSAATSRPRDRAAASGEGEWRAGLGRGAEGRELDRALLGFVPRRRVKRTNLDVLEKVRAHRDRRGVALDETRDLDERERLVAETGRDGAEQRRTPVLQRARSIWIKRR